MKSVSFAGLFLVLVAFAVAEEPMGTVVKLDKFSSITPGDWKSEKPWNLLRSHQFKLPGVKDAKAAEVSILPDLTKKPEENFTRYKDMFQIPEGKKADDFATCH